MSPVDLDGNTYHLIMKADIAQENWTVDQLINYAIQEHLLINWAAMHEIMWPGEPFRNARLQQMIREANDTYLGADALLVDVNGMYSWRAPYQNHWNWLNNNGYVCRPPVKGD